MTDGHEEEEEVGGICAANDKVARLYQQQRGQRRKRGGLTSPVSNSVLCLSSKISRMENLSKRSCW